MNKYNVFTPQELAIVISILDLRKSITECQFIYNIPSSRVGYVLNKVCKYFNEDAFNRIISGKPKQLRHKYLANSKHEFLPAIFKYMKWLCAYKKISVLNGDDGNFRILRFQSNITGKLYPAVLECGNCHRIVVLSDEVTVCRCGICYKMPHNIKPPYLPARINAITESSGFAKTGRSENVAN